MRLVSNYGDRHIAECTYQHLMRLRANHEPCTVIEARNEGGMLVGVSIRDRWSSTSVTVVIGPYRNQGIGRSLLSCKLSTPAPTASIVHKDNLASIHMCQASYGYPGESKDATYIQFYKGV